VIKEAQTANLPVSEVRNFSSAASRKTTGDAEFVNAIMMIVAKSKSWDFIFNKMMREMDTAIPNKTPTITPPDAIMLAFRKLRLM
jgi:hypothetical protein